MTDVLFSELKDLAYIQTVKGTALTHFSARYSARLSDRTASVARSGGIAKFDGISYAHDFH